MNFQLEISNKMDQPQGMSAKIEVNGIRTHARIALTNQWHTLELRSRHP